MNKLDILQLIAMFIIGFVLAYVIYNQTEQLCPIIKETVYKNIGYIDCYKDDGTGPWYDCGEMQVRCYKSKDKKDLVECPIR